MKLHDFEALAAENRFGLVRMEIKTGFAPYSEGDIAGFPPDEAVRLFKKGAATPLDADPSDARRAAAAGDGEGAGSADDVPAIPDDWEGMHHLTRVKLAKEISGGDVANKEEADEIIRAEIARRAAPAGDGEG
ncbi:hypothetical protein [Phenylobacterium sp.]|uniref:hypothetical protein n=1 Tax=Phenylobacterium sp. TaxID=1871053 RepID=UPI0019B4DF9B|nr:hypothetical protein [Phenylobacterium sp.]MBC7168319.1 hypothetical protein [Phenylobacterium sp.]